MKRGYLKLEHLFKRRKMVGLVITLLIASILIAGCSTPGTKAVEVEAEPLKIGTLVPLSHAYAVLGKSILNGMNLYLEEANNTAGGRKIQLIIEDTEMNPEVGLQKTKKLIENDQVDILTGIVSTGVAYAVRDLVHNTKNILVVTNAQGDALTRGMKSPYVFRVSSTNWQTNYPMGQWVYDNVAKEVVLSAPDYSAGHEMMNAFKEGFLQAGGKILGEIYPPLDTADYAPYLTQIGAINPPAVYAFFGGADGVRFVKQYEAFGFKDKIKLVGSGPMAEEDLFPAQGEAALGIKTGLYWVYGLENQENKKFVEAYEKKYNEAPSNFGLLGYESAKIIVEAVNAVDGDTKNKEKLLEAIKNVDFMSPRGRFTFDPVTQNVLSNVYVREAKKFPDGKIHNAVIKDMGIIVDPGK